jgi:hypothetical protein
MFKSAVVSICILSSFSFMTAAYGACQVGQFTALLQPASVIPCGEFDLKTKTCTDTAPTLLPAGTSVHLTQLDLENAEVFIGMIPTPKGERYINQFLKFKLGKSTDKKLACQN